MSTTSSCAASATRPNSRGSVRLPLVRIPHGSALTSLESHPAEPFLAVRPDFHPKRNQARQKLATLPLLRFRDLASDVYFELDRRYPEFGEEDDVRPRPSCTEPLSITDAALYM